MDKTDDFNAPQSFIEEFDLITNSEIIRFCSSLANLPFILRGTIISGVTTDSNL